MSEKRDPDSFRKLGIVSNTFDGYNGSSMIRMGNTKVMCLVTGPRRCEITESDHCCPGHVIVNIIGLPKREKDFVRRAVKTSVLSTLFTPKLYRGIHFYLQSMSEKREPNSFRNLGIVSNTFDGYDGSSMIRMGNTKVMCLVTGPRRCEITESDHYCPGHVIVNIIGLPKREKDFVRRVVKTSVLSTVFTPKLYRCKITFDIRVLLDDGNVISACLNAANIALVNTGMEMFDMFIGTGLAVRSGQPPQVDPSKADLKESCGQVYVSAMPSLMRFASLEVSGISTLRQAITTAEKCNKDALNVYGSVRQALINDLQKQRKYIYVENGIVK
uniref:RNase_PH domain-containing protein n=1 Tax=Steinernema glaseri TaxID=37863 RepID=A0A1I7YDH2_9BILA